MISIQLKISRHTWKQENIIHNEGKKQPTKTNPEITHIIDQVDKNIRTVIVKALSVDKPRECRYYVQNPIIQICGRH